MSPGEKLYQRWCVEAERHALTGWKPRRWEHLTRAERYAWERIA